MKVLTIGTFDLFHVGHVRFLARCYLYGDVTVAVNPSEFVEKFKGRKPIISTDERREVVEACKYVEAAVVNVGGRYARATIDKVKPDVLAIDTGWLPSDKYLEQLCITQSYLERNGIALVFIPRTEGVSTTDLLRRCGEPRERVGVAEDAGELDVSDSAPYRDISAGEWARQTVPFPPEISLPGGLGHWNRKLGGLGTSETLSRANPGEVRLRGVL